MARDLLSFLGNEKTPDRFSSPKSSSKIFKLSILPLPPKKIAKMFLASLNDSTTINDRLKKCKKFNACRWA
jgi:hypothetical protein